MIQLNAVQFIFLCLTFVTGFLGFLINCIEPYLPVFLVQTYRYGKFSNKTKQELVTKVEVPKRWFRHFYIFAAPFAILTLSLIIYKYFFSGSIPSGLYLYLDILFGHTRQPLVTPEKTFLACLLLTIQCWKRLYETQVVSIFSDSKMNFSHYICGFLHYWGVILCTLGEAEGFVLTKGIPRHISFDLSQLSFTDYICAVIFLWASYKQLKANYILANLRKDKDGKVLADKSYHIPSGDLFEYVSCPLQFTEILMYLMISAILWQSTTVHYVFFWVLVNQSECAILSHQWYVKNFKDYPKHRTAFIPYRIFSKQRKD